MYCVVDLNTWLNALVVYQHIINVSSHVVKLNYTYNLQVHIEDVRLIVGIILH